MNPLVRWEYRAGIEELTARRSCSRSPWIPRADAMTTPSWSAGLAGNRDIHRVGFGKTFEDVGATRMEALASPIAPRVADRAPCQKVVG